MSATQTKPAFTPGPWRANPFNPLAIHAEDEGNIAALVCRIDTEHTTKPHEQNLANARLIAAAPDLYEIVLELHDELSNDEAQWTGYGEGDVPKQLAAQLATIRATLAKASGTEEGK